MFNRSLFYMIIVTWDEWLRVNINDSTFGILAFNTAPIFYIPPLSIAHHFPSNSSHNAITTDFLLALQFIINAIPWSCTNSLTLSQTSLGFYVSAVQAFWKHCGKRRNYSQRAISPFPTVFSTCFGEHSAIFIKFEIVVCKPFQSGRV